MKAAVYTQYGTPDVFQIREVADPNLKENEILVRIHSTAVNSGDVRLRKADPFAVRFVFGILKPKINILGSVFSGEIERIGSNVTKFKAGEQVFGHTDMKFGAYAEYICMPEDGSLSLKPAALSHEEAAAIPFGGVTALHFIKKALIREKQKILVIGASGAVGSAAVQLAKSYGANVTGVCSTNNKDLVKSIGANQVIDYTKEDFTKNGESYDLIFDTVNSISVLKASRSLTENGIIILSAAGMYEMLSGIWLNIKSNKKAITGIVKHNASDLNFLKELVETSRFKPVIDRTYELDNIAEAHAYVEKGHKRGNVIITI
ncbi:NAD(P)-dependent alcohol dehydrogenase [Flavihumibacter rivuli]|uniref:NAD(P)-dependent alcohol dehydrogenase n=1 Tax=Flavihumibacter rivuli TaxID=2838156 RepID=UPI001BDF4AEF|nr:NAD(P)-dependent alcohol dehydrogenase [Flavihumibacter rivuli]ULQ56237.1 NAD(P)-dependent alcohol dehydrogenase [Flavihumibacter rivuli]